jgi:carboxylate-amine ligase
MKTALPLFSAYGIEVEYMIVNKDTLSILPIADKLIYEVAGHYQSEIAFENIAWSNELVLHVIELKTNGPATALLGLSSHFQDEIRKINNLLKKYGAKLLPTGAHPWMNPFLETKLWPHDDMLIYSAYHKIFDCRGHGWSNLQSVHLNLPFASDEEFAKLHTAIRLVLPLIPALAASTPILDGKETGLLDTRLEFYRHNQQKIPSVTGDIIPEVVFSEAEYQEKILKRMYQDISSYDVDKVLQEEWLNSRGAIARFERNTIEIRLIDLQECPQADLAIIDWIVVILKALISERWISFTEQITWDSKRLQGILVESIKNGMDTAIEADYAAVFSYPKQKGTIRDLWQYLFNQLSSQVSSSARNVLSFILREGNLAERILKLFNQGRPLVDIYQQLAECLQTGKLLCEDNRNVRTRW